MSGETPLGIFCKACGLMTPLALVCHEMGSPAGTHVPLGDSRPFLLIGRHPAADLTLNDPQVSWRHAYLQAIAGRVFCIDLESRTKTHWDDLEVAQPRGWLDPGRTIHIGPYRIHRTEPPPEEQACPHLSDPLSSVEGGPASDPCPRPVFELPFRVGGISSTWAMGGLVALVGRSDYCQLVLTDNSISQYHACLVRTPLGAWVVDLAAREGVQVNWTRVRWAWLADGDLVRFGRFTVVLRYDQPPEGIVRADVPLEAGAPPAGWIADAQRATPGPADSDRTGLALRPKSRPPGRRNDRAAPPAFPSGAPGALNKGEWEPVLASSPSPLAIWQQQMQLMETFHNDMAMMVQMFVAMHREFQSSVRDELDRVQQLTRELSRLNARLSQLPVQAEAGQAPNARLPERKARPVPGAKPPGSEAKPRPPGPEAKSRPRPARRVGEPAEGQPEARAADPRLAGRSSKVAKDEGKSRNAPPPRMGTAEVYADLTRRITELQRERRGYWERILKAING
jgi:pSer/pThr/pTyr-binding forkhead associated (FHA) protein